MKKKKLSKTKLRRKRAKKEQRNGVSNQNKRNEA